MDQYNQRVHMACGGRSLLEQAVELEIVLGEGDLLVECGRHGSQKKLRLESQLVGMSY